MTMLELCEEVNQAWNEHKTEKRISLSTLMNRYGTDKLFLHHYDKEYERHFEHLRDETFTILEIGVGGYENPRRGGESLKVWRDYFQFSTIIGLDNETKDLRFGDRVRIFRGSQNDTEFLVKLSEDAGPFDIVIDDGSHWPKDQFASFTTLFPLLRPGGIYVIEDLATSYRPAYGGDPNAPPTIGIIQKLIDGLHWQFWSGRGPTGIDQMVKSVHVSKELAFIYRH